MGVRKCWNSYLNSSNNPFSGKWNLCNVPVDYPHISASYYLSGEHSSYPVTNIMEMEDIAFE
jgi:hypothetical protein